VSDPIQLKPSKLKEAIKAVFAADLVPMVTGSPGTAKSAIIKDIAIEYNMEFRDIRLTQKEAPDLDGYPSPDLKTGRMQFLPTEEFPLSKFDNLPKGKKGWIISLEEFNSAELDVQAAAYKLVLDRMIGQHYIHPAARMIGTGNIITDKAIVNMTGTAMQSRLVHLGVLVDLKEWIDWGTRVKMDHRVLSFIKFRPDLLHRFNPDHDDITFPCPRTWEFASRIIKPVEKLNSTFRAILMGTIGEGPAVELVTFCELYKDIPTIEQIIDAPDSVRIQEEPSFLYAMSGFLAARMTMKHVPEFMIVIKKLPMEFQTITLKDVYKRDTNGEIRNHDQIREWIKTNAKRLF
jgi:hypothetical protein